ALLEGDPGPLPGLERPKEGLVLGEVDPGLLSAAGQLVNFLRRQLREGWHGAALLVVDGRRGHYNRSLVRRSPPRQGRRPGHRLAAWQNAPAPAGGGYRQQSLIGLGRGQRERAVNADFRRALGHVGAMVDPDATEGAGGGDVVGEGAGQIGGVADDDGGLFGRFLADDLDAVVVQPRRARAPGESLAPAVPP